MRILKNRWFAKFARKQNIGDAALLDAIDRAEAGLIDADLGGGVIKQRIARDGSGKSAGYRTIILFRVAERAVFVFGFAKSGQANLTPRELKEFREAAAITLAFTESQIATEVAAGHLIEVQDDQDL